MLPLCAGCQSAVSISVRSRLLYAVLEQTAFSMSQYFRLLNVPYICSAECNCDRFSLSPSLEVIAVVLSRSIVVLHVALSCRHGKTLDSMTALQTLMMSLSQKNVGGYLIVVNHSTTDCRDCILNIFPLSVYIITNESVIAIMTLIYVYIFHH
jgi:hypothetical protein